MQEGDDEGGDQYEPANDLRSQWQTLPCLQRSHTRSCDHHRKADKADLSSKDTSRKAVIQDLRLEAAARARQATLCKQIGNTDKEHESASNHAKTPLAH